MMTKKNVKDLVSCVLLTLAILISSRGALGKVFIRDITLQSGILNPEAVSAEIEGEIADRCSEVSRVQFSLAPSLSTEKEVNIYLDVNPMESETPSLMCVQSSQSFLKDVYVGILEPGYYTFNVYENEIPTFSKPISVPFDVKTLPLSTDFNQSLGGNSDDLLKEHTRS